MKIADDPAHYERRLPDGTVETYALADRAASLANRDGMIALRTTKG